DHQHEQGEGLGKESIEDGFGQPQQMLRGGVQTRPLVHEKPREEDNGEHGEEGDDPGGKIEDAPAPGEDQQPYRCGDIKGEEHQREKGGRGEELLHPGLAAGKEWIDQGSQGKNDEAAEEEEPCAHQHRVVSLPVRGHEHRRQHDQGHHSDEHDRARHDVDEPDRHGRINCEKSGRNDDRIEQEKYHHFRFIPCGPAARASRSLRARRNFGPPSKILEKRTPAVCSSLWTTSIAVSSCTSPQEMSAEGTKVPASSREPALPDSVSTAAPPSPMFFSGNARLLPGSERRSTAFMLAGTTNLGDARLALMFIWRSARSRSLGV